MVASRVVSHHLRFPKISPNVLGVAGNAGDPLVERDAELGQLRVGLRDRAGTALLVIEGEAGIGKTRLLEAAAALARTGGARVLTARASELERELPFGVVRQLLEPVLANESPDEREALLSGAAALAMPALELQPDEPAAGSFSVLHGVYWLIANMAAATPLVLCVDDLHWADEPSLRALAYLIARAEGVDMQLCGALRPNEPGSNMALIEAVIGGAHARVIHPAPLSVGAAAELVTERLGSDADLEFSAACHSATGGNPLLLTELIHALGDDGVAPTRDEVTRVGAVVPGRLGAGVLRRLDRISDDARPVARALAILGDGADLRLVSELASIDYTRTVAAIQSMARVEILESADPAAFAHPLVRAAVAADVPVEDHDRFHRTAAELLAAEGARPERLTAHLMEVAPSGDRWVVESLKAAAAETSARGAPELAARLLRRALAEPPPADDEHAVLLAAGLAEAQAGDQRAAAHLARAVELAPDPTTRAEAVIAFAPVLGVAGDVRKGFDLMLAALEAVDMRSDLRLKLEAEALNFARLDVTLRPLALNNLGRLDDSKLEDGPAGAAVLAHLAIEAYTRGESREQALELSARALAGGHLLTSPFMYGLAANAGTATGHYNQALATWDDFVTHARARGDIPAAAWGLAFRACADWRAGTLADMIADAESAVDLGRAHGFALAEGFALAFLAEALLLRGEVAEAREVLARAPGAGEQLPDTLVLGARGRLRLAEGRPLEAVEDLRHVGRLLDAWYMPNEAVAPWRADAVVALAALGEQDEAISLADEGVEAAGGWGDPWLHGQALRSRALVSEPKDRRRLLEKSAAVLRPSEARLELARTLVELGAEQRAAGEARNARETLREALDLATRASAPAVADRARDELVRAGGRPRRAAGSGPEALTPTELRVARMAAEGPTNREIAQSLFVTEKTVEAHLANAYRKLGIRGRGQLGAALAPVGEVVPTPT